MNMQDWLNELRWGALLLGTAIAILAQIAVTLLVMQPLALSLGWVAVALVEVCIVLGAFVAGRRAGDAALINGIATALICALISSAVTAARTPGSLNMWSMLFLFGTFALMGALGGFVAARLPRRDDDPFSAGVPVRRMGGRF